MIGVRLAMLLVALRAAAVCAAPWAYVTNSSDDTVSVVDVGRLVVEKTIRVGDEPRGIAALPNGRRVYVANSGGLYYDSASTVSVIDTATNSVAATIEVGTPPLRLAMDPQGRFLYVASAMRGYDDDFYPGALVVVDIHSQSVVDVIPVEGGAWDVVLSPDGQRAYVSRSDAILIVDTTVRTVVDAVLGSCPTQFLVHPDGTRMYCTDFYGHALRVLDAASLTLQRTIPVGLYPYAIAADGRGRRLYVTSSGYDGLDFPGAIEVIDPRTNTPVATLDGGSGAADVAVTRSGSRIVVTNFSAATLRVFSGRTHALLGVVPVGRGAESVVLVRRRPGSGRRRRL